MKKKKLHEPKGDLPDMPFTRDRSGDLWLAILRKNSWYPCSTMVVAGVIYYGWMRYALNLNTTPEKQIGIS